MNPEAELILRNALHQENKSLETLTYKYQLGTETMKNIQGEIAEAQRRIAAINDALANTDEKPSARRDFI